MKAVSSILFMLIVMVSQSVCQPSDQSKNQRWNVSAALGWGYALHYGAPVKFLNPVTDNAFYPEEQTTKFGGRHRLTVSYMSSKSYFFGVEATYSTYSFLEKGRWLNFWTNEEMPYEETRAFMQYGVGLTGGYVHKLNDLDNLQFSLSLLSIFWIDHTVVSYVHFADVPKFAGAIRASYVKRISKHIGLSVGIYYDSGLNKYFKDVEFVPIQAGGEVGLKYSF